ncbi:ABC transporter ATP-binding protein [Helicobacter winghamensis]|uniref:ABC transporter ATP-binding protein n=1 Tax=Helicobacter winghamensis TaxID=157268 RepID=A0A2N3PLG4_9HELI|nr:ATP-binding cassette domain-containing protein [Helicobacter winghamensis]PKT75126.1 ABC transporter ATP-binding protein [Helicobacter winghamensis]PKT82642.1 ABC transporter ATP-binding protein [Helicobacter winghamensis]PKT82834.1 ABC transporter ATP-binding protein [Helicobacter winghamensis]
MLVAKNLSFGYEQQILENVSLELGAKETLSIMGVSGSGKSTLLHILSSFLKPQSGEIRIFNDNIYTLPSDKLLALRRNDIGIIFQSHYLFSGFSAQENLEVAALLSGEKIDGEILSLFGISEILSQSVGTLSGGQQQRLSIARILTKHPKIIFADEPTGNLDRETAFSVMQLLFDYVELTQSLLVFATHDPVLAKKAMYAYKLENTALNTLS